MTEPGGGLPLIALEIVLGFGVPVAWGVWELLALRRLKRRDEEARAIAAAQAATAAGGLSRDAASGTAASPAPKDERSA